MKSMICAAIFAFSILPGAAQATNLLTNGSFESPVLSSLSTNVAYYTNGSTAITGWTVDMRGSSQPYMQLTNNFAFGGLNASDGIQFLDMTGIVGRGGGVLSNAVATSSALDYVVSFDVGGVFYTGPYGLATVDLLVNGVSAGSFSASPPSANGMNWVRYSYTFSGSGAPVRIGLYSSFSLSSSDLGVGLDNVVLESRERPQAVPEPAAWAMLIAGFAVTGAALRRKRTAARIAFA